MIRRVFFLSIVIIPALIGLVAVFWPAILWSFVVIGPLILVGVYDVIQRRHALLRVYPIIGHGRFVLEMIRPEIQQYFVESNTDGEPFSRELRSVIYQRSKGQMDTLPFGTQHDVNRDGYEWLNHSLAPRAVAPRSISVGGPDCTQPYLSSYLNISAMSFGSLSKNAILALNEGARIGGFAHNTGEGGLSPYHLRPGGDLTWQIGTGYFGCRNPDGDFDATLFQENAQRDAVKMIEIKLSQGAKPGHGGILPAAKLTQEIAEIRGVPMGQDVISPPAHSTFGSPRELLEFVAKLRELSGGKPIGFKLCMGHRAEFLGICKAMVETGILPDFVTIDGAEGGTGAAPVELSNSVGMPLRHGLLFAHNALRGIGRREHIRIIAAGKIVTGFHMFRTMALGADLCNAARAMMFALGCIQARRCNTNTCPVGVATQDASRVVGLDVEDKASRVAKYHRVTVQSFFELVGAVGLSSPDEICPEHVWRQMNPLAIRHFGQIYPYLPNGCLLERDSVPGDWRADWDAAAADSFTLAQPVPIRA